LGTGQNATSAQTAQATQKGDWKPILTGEQLKETTEDAAMIGQEPSADIAIMTLLAHLNQYSTLSKVAEKIVTGAGFKASEPFGVRKMAELRKQLHALIELV
jgi:hypothetical protein